MEETQYDGSGSENGDEVFYIFYEDKKPEASYETPTYQQPPPQVKTVYLSVEIWTKVFPLKFFEIRLTSPLKLYFDYRTIFLHTLLKMYKRPKPHQAITNLMHQIQMILGRCMFLLKVQSIFQTHMMLGKMCDKTICQSFMTLIGNRFENIISISI